MGTVRRKSILGALLLAVNVAILSVSGIVAAEVYCVPPCDGNYWLSCGSSAGDYYYKCSGGECDDCETSACDSSASQQCECIAATGNFCQ